MKKIESKVIKAFGPFLEKNKFGYQGDLLFSRLVDRGEDVIAFDYGGREKNIAVLMSYYPEYLKVVEGLSAEKGKSRGFPVGPYLGSKYVTNKPKYWGFDSNEKIEKSTGLILLALESVGLPWLLRLRDKTYYADCVDEMALIYLGVANEFAGNLEIAEKAYKEIYERHVKLLNEYGLKDRVIKKIGKKYVFVCEKLKIKNALLIGVKSKLKKVKGDRFI